MGVWKNNNCHFGGGGVGLTVLYLEYIDMLNMLKLNVVSLLKYVILVHWSLVDDLISTNKE